MKPLDGVVVLGLEQAVAVPYATRLLADLGARVIKVEKLDGDFARHYDTACGEVSSYFAWTNVGKESLAVDLKRPEGLAVVAAAVERADVVMCNLSPGAARRLGLDAETLRDGRPELIVAELSSYGDSGPYRSRKAFDALVQSETGLVAATGSGGAMARAGISVADIAAGTQMHAAVLAALVRRGRTGEGATLRLTLMEALAEWMHQPALYAFGTGQAPTRSGAHHPTIAPYGPFTCGDGETVHLAVQNDGQWRRLCAVVGPGLAADPRFASVSGRVACRDELHALLQPAFDAMTSAELLAALDLADVPAGRTRSVADLRSHPQLVARDRWVEIEAPGAVVPMLRPPVDGWEWSAGSVPGLGEHSAAVLEWLGYAPDQVRELAASGVIGL
ncbi:CaiB/BaiF CoA-transferase family protein [Actinokineospora auranticolor]|uniref:Crotonobetainyl-CoA:carnitine CoA-transferase CaiB-like acyl-CoA transferase n=1 Tax=Actinokineospora auranticolor TaxID=155976 RepID=A0A2S6GV16_9PSEU|nr:CaiB/BaiF CoA-transferase family protein [Actinokineospora auranticolor]PPK69036.1 crotonobetainyl-CoA:carnitine CoA-transferase CaiB-like acyl-CoA transferase [Actinokineospora auranticolor]